LVEIVKVGTIPIKEMGRNYQCNPLMSKKLIEPGPWEAFFFWRYCPRCHFGYGSLRYPADEIFGHGDFPQLANGNPSGSIVRGIYISRKPCIEIVFSVNKLVEMKDKWKAAA